MGSFEDEIRRNQRMYRGLIEQQQLLSQGASWNVTKSILDHLKVERAMLGPVSTVIGALDYARTLNPELDGLGASYSSAALEMANAAQQSFLAQDLARESAKWLDLRKSMLASTIRPGLNPLFDSASLEWQRQLGTVTAALDQALRGWNALTPPIGFAENLVAPTFAYSAFSRETMKRLQRADADVIPALEASLVLADQQTTAASNITAALIGTALADSDVGADSAMLDTMADLSEETATLLQDGEHQAINGARLEEKASAITLFSAQQNELVVARVRVGVRVEELVDLSMSARAAVLAQTLLQTIIAIEGARQLDEETPIFTRTLGMLEATVMLSVHRVFDKSSLGDAVDALYFLIYEASGEMKRVKPVLDDEFCEPVWQLKYLRNKWLRHDAEHGDAKKSFAKLRDALVYFGTDHKPSTTAEFTALYEAVLKRMNEFADALLSAVLTR